jgi:hypothetical protein
MRLTIEEIDEIWQSLSIGEDEIDMHEYAEAIEAAVLTKLADKLQDAERLEWLTEYAYVETCFTARGGVAEIAGTDREVPPPGKSRLYTVKDAIDAAILASKAEKP